MNDRVDLATRSPLAAARLCQESPGELLHALPEWCALSAANRSRVDSLLEGADPDFACRLVGLVRDQGFQSCDAAHQTVLLDALAGRPDADTLGAVEELAGDAEFQWMTPRDAARQATEVRHGAAFADVEAMVRGAGAVRHHPHGFGPPGALELGAHVLEIVGDLTLEHAVEAGLIANGGLAAGAAAGAVPGLACCAALGAGLWANAKEHEAGQRWGEAVAMGHGYVDQMAHHLRGDDPVQARGPAGRGAAAADQFWSRLSPAQRVALRTVEGQDQVLRALASSVESITLGAREAE